jgi:hypothetical protein
MAIDGTYNITIHTPTGDQKVKLTLKTRGNTISGTSESSMGVTTFTGTVNGNEVQWTDNATTPMGSLKINMTAKVEGDKISGQAVSAFGPASFDGTRL